MKPGTLTPISKAMNTLCHELTTPQGGAAPSPGGVTALGTSVPLPHPPGWVPYLRFIEDAGRPLEAVLVKPVEPIACDTWWCRIGGSDPILLPHTISIEDAIESWPGYEVKRLDGQDLQIWHDELNRRSREHGEELRRIAARLWDIDTPL